ncbi:hypothetical protein [Duganella aceris]|uniref:Uncharacterized protein n=1 Tax=Duganella aceris TaxID=2703883 RepID=A0ABX0FP67_9BURK|nr:hypothetical protein [Duganella aceris]NGZ86424.1 hypothetical protein [Duganella aceris]
MAIDVRQAIVGLTSTVVGGQKQVRFATRVALTRTAKRAELAEVREMRDVFRNPTPFTLSSTFTRPATTTRLEAEVKLKDDSTKAVPASKFLAAQVSGGQRKLKRFEVALTAAGVMPVGYRAVPGQGAKVDNYGNMSRGQIVQILAFFRAFPEMGYKANMTDKGKARLARGSKRVQGFVYFVGTPGDRLPFGVYQRINFNGGTAIKPVLLFVRSALYQPIFDFKYVVEQTVKTDFDGEFTRAFREAQETAR